MTQKDKQLLLIDLSARFPYNVAVDCRDEVSRFTCYLTSDMLQEIQNNNCYWEYKPFLFPLSSMTEEQKNELESLRHIKGNTSYKYHASCVDFYNSNHLDYRELIEKCLAIDATNLGIYE